MKYPQTILNLIECFKKLPGIGEKSAERMALSTLNMDEEILALFSNTLLDIPKRLSIVSNAIICVKEIYAKFVNLQTEIIM